MEGGNRSALTGLRFLAASYVLCFHYLPKPEVWPTWAAFWSFGQVPVSLFFVLSGLLMTYNYCHPERPAVSTKDYLVARLARIYPMFLFSMILLAPILYAWVGYDPPLPELFYREGDAKPTLTTLLLLHAWIPEYALFWNYPSWSVSVEAFCYAVFALVFLRNLRTLRVKSAAALAIGCCLLRLGFAGAVYRFLPEFRKDLELETLMNTSFLGMSPVFSPLYRLPEFVLGVALGHIFLRGAEVSQRFGARFGEALAYLGLSAIVLVFRTWTSKNYLNHFALEVLAPALVLPFLGLLVLHLARGGSILARLLGNRLLVLLGEVSYGLYLLQCPVDAWFRCAIEKPLFDPYTWTEFLMYFILTCLCSIATYYAIEQPVRRLARTMLRTRGSRASDK